MKKIVLTEAKPGKGMKVQRKILYHRGHIEGNKYVFKDEEIDSGGCDDDEHSMKDLKPEPYLEKEIQPGDTLPSLSLQFNCPIAELKRINIIHRDNEIFARRTIKVPMKIFTNNLVDVHTSSSLKSSKTIDPCTSSTAQTASARTYTSDTSCVPIQVSPSEGIASAISQVCGNKNRTVLEEDQDIEIFDEDSNVNPLLLQEESRAEDEKNSIYNCDGADWGISWIRLLICTLLLGCVVSILYVIYVTEDSKKNQ